MWCHFEWSLCSVVVAVVVGIAAEFGNVVALNVPVVVAVVEASDELAVAVAAVVVVFATIEAVRLVFALVFAD